MSDHEELEGTVAAWVLGALDADEAESMRVHVEGCATCRQTAARFRRSADSLPLEVEEVVPPARLRERILIAASAARASTMPSAPARKRAALAPGRWKPVATVQLGRFTAFAAAATVLLALLIGLVVGGLLGRGSISPPAPQVARFTPAGHPDSAAVFVPDSNGSKVVLVNMPLKGYSQMAVTAEDGPDGSAAPTQQPQLYGALG